MVAKENQETSLRYQALLRVGFHPTGYKSAKAARGASFREYDPHNIAT